MHDYIRTMRTGCSVPSDTEYYLLRKAMRLFAEHGEKTDSETIAAIAAAIHREPKTALEMIRSGTQNMRVLELDRETSDEDDEPMEIGSLSDEPSTLFFQAHELDALYDAFRGLITGNEKCWGGTMVFAQNASASWTRTTGRSQRKPTRTLCWTSGFPHRIRWRRFAERRLGRCGGHWWNSIVSAGSLCSCVPLTLFAVHAMNSSGVGFSPERREHK